MSRIHAITMPKWGIEMQEGTINGWHATVGQVLGKTEPLLDVVQRLADAGTPEDAAEPGDRHGGRVPGRDDPQRW